MSEEEPRHELAEGPVEPSSEEKRQEPTVVVEEEIVFRRYRKNPKTGEPMDAHRYGIKAWPMRIPHELRINDPTDAVPGSGDGTYDD